MKIVQAHWPADIDGRFIAPITADGSVNLVLAFGTRAAMENPRNYETLRGLFPQAEIVMGSSAGEILGDQVLDNSLAMTAISFEKTILRSASVSLNAVSDRVEAGKKLGSALDAPDLAMVFVLSDGQNVNGSELVVGLNSVLNGHVPVVGGLAGDGSRFEKTLVGLNGQPEAGLVVAVGLYGSALQVGFGSEGGWEAFGPERLVTRSAGNVLYELDGKPALDLYKSYLGDRAADLPASGLLFPLSIRANGEDEATVRTILNINEAEGSLIFAGDLPQGSIVQLMKAGFDRLISGAGDAATESVRKDQAQLAILISCVGRRLLLDQRVEEEIEEVKHVLGKAALCGFYSYGELSPTAKTGFCHLHNQTMTVTTLSEK